jgi:hypothetical protein
MKQVSEVASIRDAQTYKDRARHVRRKFVPRTTALDLREIFATTV